MRAEPGLSVAPGPVARIRDAGGGIAGTGFLVGDRHVMTCAHVIDDALGRERGSEIWPEEEIRLDLPFLDRTGLAGTVVAWCAMRPMGDLGRDPVSDIAVLELAEPVPGGLATRAAVLSRPAVGTGFQTFGFPAGMDNGTEAGGELRMTDAGGWHQLRDTQDHGYFVEAGFSGAPVLALDPDREGRARLLGMVVAADVDPEKRLAFAVPTTTLACAWPLLARPYKELEAFGAEDADLFFGRDAFVEELVEKVAKRPFLTVIGPSGSGKSSVVMAGLVPRLRQQGGWAVAECRPRRRPLYQLAHAIAVLGADPDETKGARHARTEELERQLRQDPGRIVDIVETTLGMLPQASRVLLVIDQFEELFTLDAEGEVRSGSYETAQTDEAEKHSNRIAEFVAVLDAIGSQSGKTPVIHALATLRADFTGQALKVRALADLMRDADVKLGPMTPAELSWAIEAPAGRFGVDFAPGLVEAIVTNMIHSAGGLPLMQFALDRLWQRQRDRELTREDYDAIGGVEGALSEHAEAFWADCSADDGERLRSILLRLVRLAPPGEQSEDTRAVVLGYEISEVDWSLARDLVDARLLMTNRDPVSGEETIEIVHEALIRAWPRLKAWLNEDREFGLWRQRLQTYLADHAAHGTVLSGDLLAEAEIWQATHGFDLNTAEAALIDTSVVARKAQEDEARREQRERVKLLEERNTALEQAADREREVAKREKEKAALEAENAEQERKTVKKLRALSRMLFGAIALAFIAAVGLGHFWWSADRERERAVIAAQEAKGRQLAVDARLFQTEIGGTIAAERAAALAIESWRRIPTSTAFQVAATVLGDLPFAKVKHDGAVWSVAFSPDGTRFATASWDRAARILDTADGGEIARIEHGGVVWSVAFSPDGKRLATASSDGTARILNAADGKEVARIVHDKEVLSVSFSPVGMWLATGSSDGTVRISNAIDGAKIAQFEHGASVNSVAFSPDGSLLATVSGYDTVRVLKRESGTEIVRMDHGAEVTSVAFSPDGARLATTSLNGKVLRIWDTISGAEIALSPDIGSYPEAFYSVAFSPDGSRIATASGNTTTSIGATKVFDASSGKEIEKMEYGEPVFSVAFNRDGSRLAAGSGNIKGSNSGTARIMDADDGVEIASIEHEAAVWTLAFSDDGQRLATATRNGIARIIDVENWDIVARVDHDGWVSSVAFSPDGGWLATASEGGTLRLLDASDGTEISRTDNVRGIISVAFSPDGNLLATGINDGTARIIGLDSEAEIARFGHGGEVFAVAFSPDGKWLATGSRDRKARIFNVSSGADILIHGHGGTVNSVAFNSNGTRLATGSEDGSVLVLDVASGAELARLEHGSEVESVTFSPDGTRLATASADGTARILDVDSGEEVARFEHGDAVWSVAYSTDGTQLATASSDGKARIVEGDPSMLFDRLCASRAGRNLTRQEWRQYIGDPTDWRPTCPEWRTPSE